MKIFVDFYLSISSVALYLFLTRPFWKCAVDYNLTVLMFRWACKKYNNIKIENKPCCYDLEIPATKNIKAGRNYP